MAYDYFEMLAKARQWAENALAAGRVSRQACQPLFDIDTRSPDSLFAADGDIRVERPLIVAFMGGTGVGKSSLLNRLAGQNIARAGVERPTSREVTLYLHQSLAIRHLPAGLALDSINISQHHDAENSHLVWMDMPDFDSIEQGNSRLVLEWLPHVDVLIYVVSPERYRDNKAWQLLLAEGHKHAWLFVMNQWDRGLPEQHEDFIRQLHLAGFADPLLFRTSCTEPDGDEFAGLLQQLHTLSGQHCRLQLAEYCRQQRAGNLLQILQAMQEQLNAGDYQPVLDLATDCRLSWQNALQQGLDWPIRQYAQMWAEQPGRKPDMLLWDDWAQSGFEDALDELVLLADQYRLPVQPLKAELQLLSQQAEKMFTRQLEQTGRAALLNPGNGLQRFLLSFTRICETLLPLLAMAAVGYKVFFGFYQGDAESAHYLGVDFAVHSGLLIALSWLMPFFLHKKLQPSLQKAAFTGLQKGLQQWMLAMDADIKAILSQEQIRQHSLSQELTKLISECQAMALAKKSQPDLLSRVLVGYDVR
jgi:energy-coupling factor transporter ATP-binding protein EcfA2